MIETTLPLPGLSSVGSKTVVARFDGGELSSDAGVLAVREIESRLGVAARLAACLDDPRAPDRVVHPLAEIIRFRLLMMTFAEGAFKVLDLFHEHEASAKANPDDWPDHLVVEACAIRKAMFANPPQTADDALAVVSVLAHRADEVIVGEAGALERVRDCLAGLVSKGVASTDTLPGTPATMLPPQPPYPQKGFTPQRDLRGWVEAGAPIVWRGQPGARAGVSRYTVMDCTIVGPFFLNVIRQDEPDTPETPFLWSLCRLLGNEFIIRGDESTLAAAKAAAEEAAREAMAVEPCEPALTDPGTGAPATHAAAVEAFNADRWGASFEAWADYSNDDRLEANTAVLAERFRLAVTAAGPLTSMDDALALAGLLNEVVGDAHNPDGWPLYGARASMVAVISEALGEMARRALNPASAAPGTPSLPPAASK